MAKSQLSFMTAVDLSAALAAKKVSAVELAQDAIGRIERHDNQINAVCVRDFERGLAAARAADAALARGDNKPLLGIPLTVKESYNVAGLPTDAGHGQLGDATGARERLPVVTFELPTDGSMAYRRRVDVGVCLDEVLGV